MERSEIQGRYKWKTSDIFTSDAAWEEEFSQVKNGFNFSKYQGKLCEKSAVLAFFSLDAAFSQRMEKLYFYASMRHDEDVREGKYLSFLSKMQSLYTRYASQTSFFQPEILSLPQTVLEGWIADKDFENYDYILSRLLAQKAHVLSDKEEKIIALAGQPLGGFQQTFSMLDNADLPLPTVKFNGQKMQLTHGTYALVMRGGSRRERKACFQAYYKAYESLLNVITATYNGNLKKDVFYKTARGYESCLSMALLGEDVPPIVYKNLIASVHKALPALHRYIRLRKKILKLPRQHMYDIYLPLVEETELKLSYEEAYGKVVEGLAPLGENYQNLLKQAYREGWIDVYENVGKRSGAYSTGVYGTHPYVLLNYQPTTGDVFTVAHEMGHALHTYHSNAAQPYEKASYTIFLAEIASTVNEVLLLKHLYKTTTDKKLKKFLINYYIDMFRTTLFRQTQFAEFEEIVHTKTENGEALSKEDFCEIYYSLNQTYYGTGVAHDREISFEWARIPHFYRSFYVYKYATGIVSAVSIVQRILSEGKSAVDDYFAFLSGGNSTQPVEILKRAGVDLTTSAPFEAAMQEFANTLKEFEKLNQE